MSQIVNLPFLPAMPLWQFFILLAGTGLIGILILRLYRRWSRNRHSAAPPSLPPVPVAPPASVPVQTTAVPPPTVPATPVTATASAGAPLFGPSQGTQTGVPPLPRVEPSQTPLAGTDDYLFGSATPMLASLLPETAARQEDLKSELVSAGYFQPHALLNLSAVRYLLIILPLLLLGVLMVIVPPAWETLTLIGCLMLALVGWAGPRLYVRSRAAERKAEIERSMPDVLDMLNMCVSQGMTILPAMQRVIRELKNVYPVLAQELQIVVEQARIGTLEHALRNFAKRVDIPEVGSFTSLLIQTERMGTSISQALSEYAEGMREMLRQRADEKANRATFQLLFPTVLCLMPAVYMFLLGPSIIELSDFFGGGNSQVTEGAQAVEQFNNRGVDPQDL